VSVKGSSDFHAGDIHMDCMQAKYSRRSGELGMATKRLTILSWYTLITEMIRIPTHIAGAVSQVGCIVVHTYL